MQIFQLLRNYKIGVIGGAIYAIFSGLVVGLFNFCGTSAGFCVVVAPSIFHQTVIELVTNAPANPWLLSLANLIIFTFEGAGIEFFVRKTTLR